MNRQLFLRLNRQTAIALICLPGLIMTKPNLKAAKSEAIAALPAGVTLTTLDNGLTIVVREDRSAPVVSAQAWAMAGSIHEGERLGAGLSHVLEHMLFKGTTTRPGSRIDQEVQEAGGYMNAYTSFDRTVYHIDLPSTGARTAIDILCDIMQNASLPADELAKELDVIRREMDMNQDDPGRRAGRRLFETAYTRSPYRYTVIGYPDVFNELTPQNITGYYREKYVPNNVFFVVVGDVKNAEVVDQIKAAYAKSKSKPLPPAVLPEEPRQTAPREIIEEAPIELGYFHFGWHIPDIRDPDIPALDVLAVLLGSGRSSRLFVEVREKQGLVNSADAWTYNPGNPGLFGMSAVVDADKFEKARAAMLIEVDKLKTKPVSTAELNKAVKQYISATLATRKTMQGQAQDLGGNWLAAGDLNFSERYLAAVKRLRPADLQRVARKYLTTENRTLYALLPTGAGPRQLVTTEKATENEVQKLEFPNGLRLLVKEDHRLPFVEFRAVFQGGVLAETSANNGIGQLLTKMLLQGTKKRSAERIASEIESVGGSIDTYGGNNSFGVNLEVLSSDFAKGLDVLADVILNPAFPSEALAREKQIQLAGIRARKDDLLKSATVAMRRGLFDDSGYGLDPLGSEDSVAAVKVADLKAMHGQLVSSSNCVIAIYGDVKVSAVKSAVSRAFGKWKPAAQPVVSKQTLSNTRLETIKRASEVRDKKQAVIVMGFQGSLLRAKDRYALELLSEACSDLGSRLFLRVRENLGLAYYVGAQNFPGLTPGYFAFYAGTEPEKVDQVEKEFFTEVEMLRAEGLTQAELDRAKAKILGQKKIARQDLGGLAMTTALDELYGLGYTNTDREDAQYQAVTLDQVKAAARKYLTPDAVVISVVKP
jgi:zinc protease